MPSRKRVGPEPHPYNATMHGLCLLFFEVMDAKECRLDKLNPEAVHGYSER
ncbi:MAG: hypothetical protein IJF61_03135 [Clostridia bacterium]|nr:hypothetical protein [Clostridia bacterium]